MSIGIKNAYKTGVHIGQFDKNPDRLPMAISFTADEVIQFLKQRGLKID